MKDRLREIADENVVFHRREERDLFRDALKAYLDKRYLASASLAAILFEKIFTTRLINETSGPAGFIPSRDNIREQLDSLLLREKKIIKKERLSFREITAELVKASIISDAEKEDYDNVYTKVRNPISHGLTLRLFEEMLGRTPDNTFEVDANYEAVYSKAAEKLLIKIYELMTIKVLRKQ